MITEIGIVAGEIWHFLDKSGKVRLSEIYANLDRPKENILMSVGWLAREGHVILEGDAPDYEVSLRK